MIDKSKILRSIGSDFLEYIQEKVNVKFDYKTKSPVCFYFRNKWYWVNEVILSVKTYEDFPVNGFVVRARNEVFFLYFHFFNYDPSKKLNEGNWVLSYRILKDSELMSFDKEDRDMLVNMTLKRIADFHGHICPELVIGAKFCEYVTQLINQRGEKERDIFIIAENSTSAIDAIQMMLGTTIGNNRLKILDKGKHNYLVYFINEKKSFKFVFKYASFIDEDDFIEIEGRILKNKATLDDLIKYQDVLDCKITTLVNLSPSDIFDIIQIPWREPEIEVSASYIKCSSCNEPVLKTKLIYYKGKFYCASCFKLLKENFSCYGVQ